MLRTICIEVEKSVDLKHVCDAISGERYVETMIEI